MGNESSKRSKTAIHIHRVGFDPVAVKEEEPTKATKTIVTLSSGAELTHENVCAIFEQFIRQRNQGDETDGKGKSKKKDKDKAKLDYERTLGFLCEEVVLILKNKEKRESLLSLSAEAFEELIKSDDLMVPDESMVLLALGAWAERRANDDELKQHNQSSSGVNLRGSDELFQSLGQGAAKLLEPASAKTETANDTPPPEAEGATIEKDEGEAGEKTKKDEVAEDAKKEQPEAGLNEKPTLSNSQEINLRGTAGLYATFASAYSNMISDEEMARKLQEEELEDDKVRRKMMEEEDERLARALQEGELADGGSLPDGFSPKKDDENNEEEDLEPIPEYKLTLEYIERIKNYMKPLIPNIRFSMLPLNILNTLANENLVPTLYLTEAYKYHALASADMLDLLDKNNPRYKRRRYLSNVEWDRNWHGQHIQISSDGKKATKTQSSWYSLACASEGFKSGKHFWAVKVDGDEAYIGVTQKGNTSLDNYLGGNHQSWAFRTSYKYSSSHGNGYYGEPFGRGDVIGVLLDMDSGSLTFFKNGKNLGVCFVGLPRSEKLYPAVGWRAGNMSLVQVDYALYSTDLLSHLRN